MVNGIANKRLIVWLPALMALAPHAARATLSSPFFTTSAAVLPQGVSNPEFDLLTSAVDTKYDDQGHPQPLGAPLNQTVTWQKVLDVQGSDSQKASIQSVLASAGITNMSSSAGSTTGQINTYVSVFDPVFKFGVTDRLSVGIAVPIFHVSSSTAAGFVGNSSSHAFLNAAAQASSPMKAADAAHQLNTAVAEQLSYYGYAPMQSSSVTGVGDIHVGAKYQVFKNDRDTFSVKPELILPTGSKTDPNQIVDLSTGSGEFGLTANLFYDHELSHRLTVRTFASYTYQLPDSLLERIPQSADSMLTPDVGTVNRRIGDQVRTGATLNYDLARTGLTLSGGYNFQYQGQTQFSGAGYSPERYGYLEALNPEGYLHSAIMSLNFSTIGFYREKQFKMPMEASITYSVPIAGENVYQNNAIGTEMVVYF